MTNILCKILGHKWNVYVRTANEDTMIVCMRCGRNK